MASLIIAGLALEAVHPEDLDDRLGILAGVSSAEMHRILTGPCIASTIAAAVMAFVAEPPPRAELARAIAKEGANKVRREILAVYAEVLGVEAKVAPAPPEDPPELTVELYCDRYIAGEGREDPAMLQFAVNNGEAIEAEFQRRNEAALEAAKTPAKGKKKGGK
jgi:hypothetical protein